MKQVVVVLGMHRSGTSAMTGALCKLGFSVGRGTALVPAGTNRKGFFEKKDVIRKNGQILRTLGAKSRSFTEAAVFEDDWLDKNREKLNPLIEEQKEIFENTIVGVKRPVIKDPRMCRLVPIWLEIFDGFGYAPKFIIMVRHPDSVARSFLKSRKVPRDQGLLKWAAHVLDAEKYTRGYDRVFVRYETLIRAQKQTVNRIRSELGIPVQKYNSGAAKFLEKRFNHNKEKVAILQEHEKFFDTLYQDFSECVDDPDFSLEHHYQGFYDEVKKWKENQE